MGVPPLGSGCEATPSAADASSQSRIPNADDVRLLGAGPDHRGGFGFTFADGPENGVIHLLAQYLYEMMGCGTPHELNCVQMEVIPRDFAQPFTLTLQRQHGKTPLRLKAEARKVLEQTLEAIESGRREPLEIARDSIRNWLDADLGASGIETEGQDPQGLGAEHESPTPQGDAQTPSRNTPMTNPAEDIELLPCPFCGGEALLSNFRPMAFLEYWRVECSREECSSRGPERGTEADTIAAWNTRAALTPTETEHGE